MVAMLIIPQFQLVHPVRACADCWALLLVPSHLRRPNDSLASCCAVLAPSDYGTAAGVDRLPARTHGVREGAFPTYDTGRALTT